jgi:hypothetical protein
VLAAEKLINKMITRKIEEFPPWLAVVGVNN